MKKQGTENGEKLDSRRRDGTMLLLVVIAMLGMIGVAALVIDGGHVYAARTELQNVADSSALACAAQIVNDVGTQVTASTAVANAIQYGGLNEADQQPITIQPADITLGTWNFATSTLQAPVDPNSPPDMTGCQVTARLDQVANAPVQTIFSRVFGRDEVDVVATAVGYRGFVGSFFPGEVELPIAIDCCAVTQAYSDCTSFSCQSLEDNPPNFGADAPLGCYIDYNPAYAPGTVPATCLEFHSTPEQNACWTLFSDSSTSVNSPGLIGIIENGNGGAFEAPDKIYLDNGTKTPSVAEIYDKFHGLGSYAGNPSGEDLNNDGYMDSWIVGFPLVACQSEDHCAKGVPAAVVGGICFEIQEVEVTIEGEPGKRIKGRFFCPTEEEDCGLGNSGPGGLFFGKFALPPVLVQ